MYGLRSKLTNKMVRGVFWPVVKSLEGVRVFFPKTFDACTYAHTTKHKQVPILLQIIFYNSNFHGYSNEPKFYYYEPNKWVTAYK